MSYKIYKYIKILIINVKKLKKKTKNPVLFVDLGILRSLAGKESAYNTGDPGLIPGS